MLVNLSANLIRELSQRLQALPEAEKAFLPHDCDIETLKSLLKQKDKHYYIYLDDSGKSTGYGMVRAWEGYDTPTLGCVIWPVHRRRGHGARLVSELISKAGELGYSSIKLKVSLKNEVAHRLYVRLGFEGTGEVAADGQIWMQRKTDKGPKDA